MGMGRGIRLPIAAKVALTATASLGLTMSIMLAVLLGQQRNREMESAEGRRMLTQLLDLRPNVPCATVRLTRQNMIRLTGRLPLGGNATPSRLVATATAIVASARPLVDVVLFCCSGAARAARKPPPGRQDMRQVA